MDIKKIKQLADVLLKNDLSELEIREDDDYLLLKRQRLESVAPRGRDIKDEQKSRAKARNPEVSDLGLDIVSPAALEEDTSNFAEAVTVDDAPDAVEAPAAPESLNLTYVESPMVGTFYRSAQPGSPPFAEVGDSVKVGDDLCIIEAMKMMNYIKSEIEGKVIEVLVQNGQPVEYGQRLFALSN